MNIFNTYVSFLRRSFEWTLVNIFKHSLGLMAFIAMLLFTVLIVTHVGETLDLPLLIFITFVFSVSSLFMIVRTKWTNWTILSAGLLGTFLADALVYGNVALARHIGPYDFYITGITIARSFFVVAGFWVLVGITQEWLYEQCVCRSLIISFLRHPIRTIRNKDEYRTDLCIDCDHVDMTHYSEGEAKHGS